MSRNPYGNRRAFCHPQSPVAINPEDFYADRGTVAYQRAKQLCLACPLHWSCQEYALENGIPGGIWGGLDERERAEIYRRAGRVRPSAFVDSYTQHVNVRRYA